jgi:hypothetical protein
VVELTGTALPEVAAFIKTALLLPLPLVQLIFVWDIVVALKVTFVACVDGTE